MVPAARRSLGGHVEDVRLDEPQVTLRRIARPLRRRLRDEDEIVLPAALAIPVDA
jgi:hypothetical protein